MQIFRLGKLKYLGAQRDAHTYIPQECDNRWTHFKRGADIDRPNVHNIPKGSSYIIEMPNKCDEFLLDHHLVGFIFHL